MEKLLLNEGWKLHDTRMEVESPQEALAEGGRWLTCALPCDVRMPLIEAGVIRDPVLADYSMESEWIEDRAWWFFKDFSYSGDDCDAAELEITMLDTNSVIFLNGVRIGSQCNVHRAFRRDVAPYLRKGQNQLAVRVTTGLETVTGQDVLELDKACCAEFSGDKCYDKHRGDLRRPFVRRPQYSIGWDWGPRVVTCGITGEASLKLYRKIAVRELHIVTESIGPSARLSVCTNIELLDFFATAPCTAAFTLEWDGQPAAEVKLDEFLLTAGLNYVRFTVDVPQPRLWWPNGYGEQNLYTVRFCADCEGVRADYPEFLYGIRTLSLDLGPIPHAPQERYFAFLVNGVRVFCKGADWIPADSIYARVTPEKYRTLVEEAVRANFNTFRVWGGGLYERDLFYELCDRYGILLWQDFMFACATYPDHREQFVQECRKEMDEQTKRLRNHACIGLFCGNNENHEIFYARGEQNNWNITYTRSRQYGLWLSNGVAKEVIHANCPNIPYWPSSPFGGTMPAEGQVGDVHYWGAAMMNPDMERRFNPFVYDEMDAKFVSEYGYIGPCSMETIRTYFDGKPIQRDSHIWKLHNNGFEKDTVVAGIARHYGVDTENLSLEDYLRYAGAVHSFLLEYSLEAIRFKRNCHGAIFWMYEDTWGEVGWTIIDYYLRRKMAYYGVRRAFATRKLTLRQKDGRLILQVCNDAPQSARTVVRVGRFALDSAQFDGQEHTVEVPARSRTYLDLGPLPEHDATRGLYAALPEDDSDFVPGFLWEVPYAQLQRPQAQITVRACQQRGDNVELTVEADAFTPFVWIEGGADCTDNGFPLLPNQPRRITVSCARADALRVTCL